MVALGDSITWGWSTVHTNRLPELLSSPNDIVRSFVIIRTWLQRLLSTVRSDGAALSIWDVVTVRLFTCIVAVGINDLMSVHLPNFATGICRGTVGGRDHHRVAARSLGRGPELRIYGATITPNGSSLSPGAHTPDIEAKRQAVNRWIRSSGAFDGVVDFDAAVRDPSNPKQLLPAYSADGVHLTDAGYEAMANTVNLQMLF